MEEELVVAIRSGDEEKALTIIEGLNTAKGPALHEAVKRGRLTIATRLLQKGAEVNPSSEDFPRGLDNPLSIACSKKNVEMVKLLLRFGADPFLGLGSTGHHVVRPCPFEEALVVHHSEILRELLSHQAVLSRTNAELAVMGLILVGENGMLQTILDFHTTNGMCTLSPTSMSKCLNDAAKLGNISAVELLLDRGARIDNLVPGSMRFDPIVSLHVDGAIEKPADSTALMQACRWRQVAIVEDLLQRGADVNQLNSIGWTALQATVAGVNRTPACAQQLNQEIVQLLLHNGAYLNPSDHPYNKYSPNRDRDEYSLDVHLPGPLDRVLETIAQLNLYTNRWLLRVAIDLIKGGARPITSLLYLLVDLHDNCPDAENAFACDLTRLCVRSSQPHGKLFYRQQVTWSSRTTRMAEVISDSFKQALTLQSLCCWKIRDVIRPPLIVNLKSEDVHLPVLLKRDLLELL